MKQDGSLVMAGPISRSRGRMELERRPHYWGILLISVKCVSTSRHWQRLGY